MRVQPTARELQVLAACLRYGSRKLAAAELCISPETVSMHSANLYRKLGVQSRDQAAIALGWLEVPSLFEGVAANLPAQLPSDS